MYTRIYSQYINLEILFTFKVQYIQEHKGQKINLPEKNDRNFPTEVRKSIFFLGPWLKFL